jgi:hypothetical protein
MPQGGGVILPRARGLPDGLRQHRLALSISPSSKQASARGVQPIGGFGFVIARIEHGQDAGCQDRRVLAVAFEQRDRRGIDQRIRRRHHRRGREIGLPRRTQQPRAFRRRRRGKAPVLQQAAFQRQRIGMPIAFQRGIGEHLPRPHRIAAAGKPSDDRDF